MKKEQEEQYKSLINIQNINIYIYTKIITIAAAGGKNNINFSSYSTFYTIYFINKMINNIKKF